MGGEVQDGGTHVNPWLIHANVWQKPLQYCEVISLQLININGKKKKTDLRQHNSSIPTCDFVPLVLFYVREGKLLICLDFSVIYVAEPNPN